MTMPTLNPTDINQPVTDGADLLEGQAGDMQWREPVQTPDQARNAGTDPATGLGRFDALTKGHDPAEKKTPEQAGEGGKADALIKAAMTQLGVQYVYGAHQWGKALDCSGFTQQAFAQLGIQIGGDTYSQVQQGTAVEGGLANAKPGDLIFTVGDKGMRANGHVGIYLGGGKVIAAPHSGTVVQIQDWSNRTPTAIRRYF